MTQQLVSFGAWAEIIAAVALLVISLALQYLPSPAFQRMRRVRSLRLQPWYMRGLYLLGTGIACLDMFYAGVATLHHADSSWIPVGALIGTAVVLVWLLRGGGLLRP